jgi:gamma-glutamylcyclotransferase (GGCT)/AIG2-like uncharacterized protein YtfP
VFRPAATLRLFVYGTLKRGGRYHARFCGGALSIEPASVRGRLYTSPAGYPVLVVPPDSVLAHGSRDAIADVGRQEARLTRAVFSEGAVWQDVHGELQTFDDPADRLAAIDALEDFHPGAPSLYLRVLLPVRLGSERVAAWAYVGNL